MNEATRVSRIIRCTVEYDGEGFAGSQLQPDRPTVQGELEAVLSRLFDRPTRISAAGRTDAGVHATAQEVGFETPAGWELGRLVDAANALLPDSIRVQNCRPAEAGFHPRFTATGRRYEYFIGDRPGPASPLRHRRIWQIGCPVSTEGLQSSSAVLIGPGDFANLSRSGQPERGTGCTIERAAWLRTAAGDLRFEIVADRFLHHMVRYLVAVQVEMALGRRAPGELRALLRGADQASPPRAAPAAGLYLTGVRYPDGWNRAPGVPGLWPLATHRGGGPKRHE
ncbi:MAG: tRNA pseudouridine(38-40) synthase TruA [marine benthic group bacterium]|nr:tRNA pseudouridine(38-40) synthase TruA [Gemmatimonadota bacterium]